MTLPQTNVSPLAHIKNARSLARKLAPSRHPLNMLQMSVTKLLWLPLQDLRQLSSYTFNTHGRAQYALLEARA